MRATLMYAAGDVRVEDVPDPSIVEPTDAIIRVTSACICGSDLWPYADLEPTETGRPMGHEAIGVVEDVGADVRTIKRGDLVVMPFAFSDGTCAFCHEGLHTACVHGGFFDGLGTGAAQAEAVRVPLADGTLYPLPVGEDDALMPSLLTLSDVLGTGHHAAVVAGVKPGDSRGRRRRRRRRPVRRDRRQAPRRRADHHHGPPRGPDRAGARVRRHRRRRRARRGGGRSASASSPAASASTRVLECVGTEQATQTVGRDRAPRRRDRPRRRPALRGGPARAADVLQERHGRRRPRAGARLHRRAAARHPRRHASSPAASSTAPSASTACPTATARWPTASRSRCW